MRITFDDIAMDVDYGEIGLLYNHLMHEVKRMSTEEFVEKYERELENLASNDYEWNMGVAIVKIISGGKTRLEPRKLDKFIASPYFYYCYQNFDVFEDYEKEEVTQELAESYDNALKEFRDCYILYDKLDEAY